VAVGELEKAEEQGLVEAKGGKAAPVGKGTEIPSFGMSLSDLSPVLQDTYSIPEDAKGVVVTAVQPTSEAAEKTLGPGDLILEINQQPVNTAVEAKKLVDEAEKAKKSSVLLLVDRQGKGDVRFVALRFKSKKP
jgi:serine protease Do